MAQDTQFTKEALKAQDGKKVPLRLGIGGPVIGEAVLKYVSEDAALEAHLRIDDPNVVDRCRPLI